MADDFSEKRRIERFLADDTLISVTLKPVGHDKEVWGLVTDTSAYGFQISIPLEIQPKTSVLVTITKRLGPDHIETEHLVGIVRWCRPDTILEDTYSIGIEI
jgi:hypothetical protein